MRQTNQALNKEFLLGLCNDYNLPVSPTDNVETLENYLKAVSDESASNDAEETDDRFLEEDPVYIGKYESAILAYFRSLIHIKKHSS